MGPRGHAYTDGVFARISPAGTERIAHFEHPGGLDAVCTVLYLLFNEGDAASSGDAWTRPTLCHEALRLARHLAALLPKAPEVLALQALMELQASRLPARTDALPLLPAVRSDLLYKLGRFRQAGQAFQQAAAQTHNERERALLLQQAREAWHNPMHKEPST